MLREVFSLDVIGDPEKSVRNTEIMWKAGIPAIPTFHLGEPWEFLEQMAKDYPKIALGGCARKSVKVKMQWVGQCFARVWPKSIHGLGMSSEPLLIEFPFHSTDASTWQFGPLSKGRWTAYGSATLRCRGRESHLKAEIEHFLKIEDRVEQRWAAERKKQGWERFALRLALTSNQPRIGAAMGERRPK
jgi:hypothetical protein